MAKYNAYEWMNYRLDDRLAFCVLASTIVLMERGFKNGSWIKNTSTHSHNLAPLLHILPHGVDDVTAHVLPSSAFLPHPDQTHPVRAEQSADSRQPDKPSALSGSAQPGHLGDQPEKALT